MLEIEMKFPVTKTAPILERLNALGYKASMTRKESDLYFNNSSKCHTKTDEVLRLRTINDEQTEITYKGPKQGKVGKVRTEIEVPIAGGNSAIKMTKLLECLGYIPTKRVTKERTYYLNAKDNRMTVTLDEVEGLGTYIEIETQIKEEYQAELYELALHDIKNLAHNIELKQDERKSYIELLLAKG